MTERKQLWDLWVIWEECEGAERNSLARGRRAVFRGPSQTLVLFLFLRFPVKQQRPV